MKEFRHDLEILFDRLKNHKHFTFSKYADGEYGILVGHKIGNNDFQYTPDDKKFFDDLWASFKYNHPDYYIGIGCPCCMGINKWQWMINNSSRDDEHLTWANQIIRETGGASKVPQTPRTIPGGCISGQPCASRLRWTRCRAASAGKPGRRSVRSYPARRRRGRKRKPSRRLTPRSPRRPGPSPTGRGIPAKRNKTELCAPLPSGEGVGVRLAVV